MAKQLHGVQMKPGSILESADGVQIHISEATHRHMLAHSGMLDLCEEAVGRIRVSVPHKTGRFEDSGESGDTLGFEVDMHGKVGNTICVPAPKRGSKIFAKRLGREIPTRVVVDIDKVPTNFLVIWLRRYDNGHIELRTCYAGRFAPREPSDPFFTMPRTAEKEEEFQVSFDFWSSHALIHDGKSETWEGYWTIELYKLGILA